MYYPNVRYVVQMWYKIIMNCISRGISEKLLTFDVVKHLKIVKRL